MFTSKKISTFSVTILSRSVTFSFHLKCSVTLKKEWKGVCGRGGHDSGSHEATQTTSQLGRGSPLRTPHPFGVSISAPHFCEAPPKFLSAFGPDIHNIEKYNWPVDAVRVSTVTVAGLSSHCGVKPKCRGATVYPPLQRRTANEYTMVFHLPKFPVSALTYLLLLISIHTIQCSWQTRNKWKYIQKSKKRQKR